ncbi:hypothetical protein [Streptomyces sp. NPDC050428]|uniref:hypothetical protein n=1 Tax=Streptomyces sp. NPDC050428 TaxID=3155757 RepID=UPI003426DD8F
MSAQDGGWISPSAVSAAGWFFMASTYSTGSRRLSSTMNGGSYTATWLTFAPSASAAAGASAAPDEKPKTAARPSRGPGPVPSAPVTGIRTGPVPLVR